MTSKVLNTISKHNMLSDCGTLGIGLSGGADSVCLCHILLNNKEHLGVKQLKAIHIHHGIRGTEADRDLEFAREFCEKNGIDFIFYKADVPREAQETGESLEECARRIRYEFFEKSGCDKIATAHNMNDNMETFIFNLSRGASLSGLCGIPYTRDIYIRPLLDCTRDEIENYIKENGLNFVTDSTNLCDDYTRNKIRHNILPHLFELNSSFDKAFAKCNDSLNISKDYIFSNAKELVDKSRCDGYFDCTIFENCHNALKYQIISLILKEQNAKNISREHLDSILYIIENNGTANLGGNVTANAQRKHLFFGKFERVDSFAEKLDFSKSEFDTKIGKFSINIFVKKDLQILNKQDIDKLIDYDKISNDVFLRNRLDGDAYKLPNRPSKTLKKLFNEYKIPLYDREKMVILADDENIIWTEYFGVANAYKVDSKTEKFLQIKRVGK